MSQLSLLDWTPPRQVIVFPIARRQGKIRHVAQILAGKNGNAARAYWRQVIRGMSSQLETVGLSDDEIEVHLRQFFDAVQAELNRMNYAGRSGRPGGDAA